MSNDAGIIFLLGQLIALRESKAPLISWKWHYLMNMHRMFRKMLLYELKINFFFLIFFIFFFFFLCSFYVRYKGMLLLWVKVLRQ